jgi:hypothetical protein
MNTIAGPVKGIRGCSRSHYLVGEACLPGPGVVPRIRLARYVVSVVIARSF